MPQEEGEDVLPDGRHRWTTWTEKERFDSSEAHAAMLRESVAHPVEWTEADETWGEEYVRGQVALGELLGDVCLIWSSPAYMRAGDALS